MEVIKIEAGEYKVLKDDVEYRISKDSYGGGWNIYNGPTYKDYVAYKNTKKECLDFIEHGCSVKILDKITMVPDVGIDTHFRVKGKYYSDRRWTVDDVVYSTARGKWSIVGHYYNDSIDSDRNSWDEDEFETECERVD